MTHAPPPAAPPAPEQPATLGSQLADFLGSLF